MIRIILIWTFFLWSTTAFAQIPIRDVSHINTPTKLTGDWGYAKGQAVLPQDTQSIKKILYISQYLENKKLEVKGVSTFVIDLKTTPDKPLSLDLNLLANPWVLYINNQLICKSGTIDIKNKIYITSPKHDIVGFIPSGQITRITLWIANSQHHHFGVASPIIAPAGVFEASHIFLANLNLVIISILLAAGLYHLGLFIAWKRDKAPLWFGLFLIVFVVRIATTGEKIATSMFDSMTWDIMTRTEYISGYLTLPLFILYISSLYPKQSNKTVQYINIAIGAVFILMALFTSTLFFTSTMPFTEVVIIQSVVFVSWVLYKAFRAKEPNSTFAFVTFIIFSVSVIHDVLMFVAMLDYGQDWAPIGFIFYLFAQAVILLQRYANAFQTLQKNEADLEHIITKRTSQLNNLLSQRELLMHELNHRVKNNLQFIIGLLWTKRSRASEETQEILLSLQSQIQAIATVHETLCDQGDISLLDGVNYLKTIIDALKNLYPDVTFTYAFGKEGLLSMDDTVSLGLVVSELVSNSIKHAFSSRIGTVHIEFEVQNNIAKLTYSDGETVFQNIDFLTASPTRKKLGWSMIMELIRQLNGKTTMENDCFTILFTADKTI
jgi:two-component sensor histidine kinase